MRRMFRHFYLFGAETVRLRMSEGEPIDRLPSAAELRDRATRAGRFASWLAPLDLSRPKLLAYADELDARAAALDAGETNRSSCLL
jgi:hypothetical protein